MPFPDRFQGLAVLCLLGLCAHSAPLYSQSRQATPTGLPSATRLEQTENTRALIHQGVAYRTSGHYDAAASALEAAVESATAHRQALLEAVAAFELGEVEILRGNRDTAERYVRESLAMANRLGQQTLYAAASNSLGTLVAERQGGNAAQSLYRSALKAAQAANDAGLQAAIHRNLAASVSGQKAVLEHLTAADRLAQQVADAPERAELLLGTAIEARQSIGGRAGDEFAKRSLGRVSQIHGARSETYALAFAELAELALNSGATREAMGWTEQALAVASPNAHDLRAEGEWRLARLYVHIGSRSKAIQAYRRAVTHSLMIRLSVTEYRPSGRLGAVEPVQRLYAEFADLLLRQAKGATANQQALLRDARDTIERLRANEVEDFFRQACLAPRTADTDALANDAAVLYPVVFPDRTELLVRVNGTFHSVSVPHGRDRIRTLVAKYSRALRERRVDNDSAYALYELVIEPVLDLLREADSATLVVVPSGALRQLPFAALYGGSRYLIEEFAVVTLPYLRILDSNQTARARRHALLAGLSRPGPVVNELPLWWVSRQVGGRSAAACMISPIESATEGKKRNLKSSLDYPDPARTEPGPTFCTREQKADALALPAVTGEIENLAETVSGRTLLNEDFRLERFEHEVRSGSYDIVHIASHALFGKNPGDSFIATYDKVLSIDALANALKPRALSDRPVDLLVLSACETAEGDDQTPLGLTGIALDSGARSIVGTLWTVDDDATRKLMTVFYQSLAKPKFSKAEALRQAQLALLNGTEYSAPGYWAPFILVGHWR